MLKLHAGKTLYGCVQTHRMNRNLNTTEININHIINKKLYQNVTAMLLKQFA